jgi:hypothetical protein
VVAFLDVPIRFFVSILASFHWWQVPLALKLSFLHLALMISIYSFLRTFEIRLRTLAAATLISTNFLFLAIFVVGWVTGIGAGRQRLCKGSANPNYSCDWIDEVITWAGVGTIAVAALVQVAINLVPALIVWLASSKPSDTTPASA